MSESGKKQREISRINNSHKGKTVASGFRVDEAKNRWLKIEAVAQILSCTKRHVYNLIMSGALEAIKIGARTVRVSELSLLAFTGKNKINPEDFFDPDIDKK